MLMFKNRAFQVKVVKTDEEVVQDLTVAEDIYVNRLVQAKLVAVDVMREGAKLCAGYVILDTARKVLIAKAGK